MNIKNLDNTETNEVTQTSELLISEKEMKNYKQAFEVESLAKRKQYLQAIQEHNKTLISKIKEFDQKVNAQVSSLAKKIVPKRRFVVPKFEEMQTKLLREKFEELQKLRKQIQKKRTGTDSLEFLMIVKRKYEMKMSEVTQNIVTKRKEIQHLKKIKQKSQSSNNIIQKEMLKIGEIDIFNDEIEHLRLKVQEKNQSLRNKKEQFLSLYKQNKSNKSIVIQTPAKEEKVEQDPQLIALKHQYEALGKRVDVLKLKKANLLNEIKADEEETKKLQKRKSKLESSPKAAK